MARPPSISVSPSSWLRNIVSMPSFQFMVHDRWANALFLHWKVPPHLESILEENTAPFHLDRFDGSAWIGLIILTEENVGPSVGRTKWTCVTHHGINVRSYVKGPVDDVPERPSELDGVDGEHDKQQQQQEEETRGIHFSSLECDDEFTSFGANFFGMPYRVAKMMRTRSWCTNLCDDTAEPSLKGIQTEAPASSHSSCEGSSSSAERYYYRIRSERLRFGTPSLSRIVFHAFRWWSPRVLRPTDTEREIVSSKEHADRNSNPDYSTQHYSTGDRTSENRDTPPLLSSPPPSPLLEPQTFTVDCSWSRSSCEETTQSNRDSDDDDDAAAAKDIHDVDDDDDERSFSEWACERYFVYTQKYGNRWQGKVEHEPWPMVRVRLDNLSISGVGSYEPEEMRPLLSHMAKTQPDRVGFSPGVGPVRFQMLLPLR